jgi:hypothetical protein
MTVQDTRRPNFVEFTKAMKSSQRRATAVLNGSHPGFVCEVSSSSKTNRFFTNKTQPCHPFKERLALRDWGSQHPISGCASLVSNLYTRENPLNTGPVKGGSLTVFLPAVSLRNEFALA